MHTFAVFKTPGNNRTVFTLRDAYLVFPEDSCIRTEDGRFFKTMGPPVFEVNNLTNQRVVAIYNVYEIQK